MGARKLKLLSDHNIDSSVLKWLGSLRRIDLVTASDVGLQTSGDPELVRYAHGEGRVLLAGDKGFLNTTILFALIRES